MLGRAPGNIQAIRPIKEGVIADFEITEAMLRYFIRKAHNRRTLVRPRIMMIGVLTGGGSLLKDLDVLLRDETKLPIVRDENPVTTVILGSGKALDDFSVLKQVTID